MVALVVDDESGIRKLVAALLAGQGFQALEAVNGLEALHLYGSYWSQLALVITDVQMPVMDGMDAARAIRNLDGDYFRKLPIIALTASVLSHERLKIFECGMDDYVMKPFIPALLFEKIRIHLSRSICRL
jgi:CheY-like chemotaxis protein